MIKSTAAILCLLAAPAAAWDTFTDTLDDGRVLHIAEVMGDGGAPLSVICEDGDIFIEALFPGLVADTQTDDVLLLQVDRKPEMLIAGFWDPVDNSSAAFIGIDLRNRPAVRTPDLIKQMKAGNELYLGDPDRAEAVERWSLKGSSKAIGWIEAQCR